jgi:hypothetical protein
MAAVADLSTVPGSSGPGGWGAGTWTIAPAGFTTGLRSADGSWLLPGEPTIWDVTRPADLEVARGPWTSRRSWVPEPTDLPVSPRNT